MQICILSMFSNSSRYFIRYAGQIDRFQGFAASQGFSVRCVWCEGDSTDDTYEQLAHAAGPLNAELFQHHHGNPIYGSIEHPQRFRQLSRIWNEMFQRVTPQDDIAIIVESDLIWNHRTMMALVWLAMEKCAVIAPMVMQGQDRFHDVWAFRRNGQRFTNEPPYHPDLDSELLEVDSAGSVLVMPTKVLRLCRATEKEELVGLCGEARQLGWRIWCDPRSVVQHP